MKHIELMKCECEKQLNDLSDGPIEQQFDDIQNEVMAECFGDDYYSHVGSDDEVEEAYNETCEIRVDYILKANETKD